MTETKTVELPRIAKELAGLDHVPVASLEPFQGKLKELSEREYNKLKKSILENGLIVPFFVWLETGKLLDGHQRTRVFMREGWLMDVPIVYISAASEQDAKRKLLVISSQYGRVTKEGWDTFTWDLEDDWLKETVQFDALPLVFSDFFPTEAANDPHAEWEGMPEFEQEDKTSYQAIHVHFKNAEEVAEFGRLLNQSLTDKTRSIWFSQREQMDDGRERYIS